MIDRNQSEMRKKPVTEEGNLRSEIFYFIFFIAKLLKMTSGSHTYILERKK